MCVTFDPFSTSDDFVELVSELCSSSSFVGRVAVTGSTQRRDWGRHSEHSTDVVDAVLSKHKQS